MDVALNTIHHGDCIELMKRLPAGSVDLAFADPPFNIGYEYDVYDDRKDREHYLGWSRQWISAVHQALKPSGTFWLAIGDEYAAELKLMSQEIGFHSRSWVIWYYTFGVNCARKFTRSHAHLFYFVKDRENFTFRENDLANRIPSARQLVYNDARANPRGRLPDDTWILRPQDLADCFTAEEDTWYIPRVAGTFKERAGFHGCQMPEQLLGRIIRCCSNPGEVVMDPFSGSATTVAVAKKLGRQYVAFDLSADYVQQGLARLDRVRWGDQLDGSPEPRVSAPATPSLNSADSNGLDGSLDDGHFSKDKLSNVLIEAFKKVSSGFSLDRVIADPELNAQLANECRRLGLPGDELLWNRTLFGLRKATKLASVPTTQRTTFDWAQCDDFLFASEIAMRQMRDQGFSSLDEILCNPILASQFDKLARSLAPGYTSLNYRWAALNLRKKAKLARARASLLRRSKLSRPVRADELVLKSMDSFRGVYLLSDEEEGPIYAGESLNLPRRFSRKFGKGRKFWLEKWPSLRVQFLPLPATSTVDLLAYQSHLMGRKRPLLNDLQLAAAT